MTCIPGSLATTRVRSDRPIFENVHCMSGNFTKITQLLNESNLFSGIQAAQCHSKLSICVGLFVAAEVCQFLRFLRHVRKFAMCLHLDQGHIVEITHVAYRPPRASCLLRVLGAMLPPSHLSIDH